MDGANDFSKNTSDDGVIGKNITQFINHNELCYILMVNVCE